MITLEDLINEMLSIEKVEVNNPTFGEKIHSFVHRREIEKRLQDEQENDNLRVMKLGKEAESFLSSSYYRNLVEPHIRQTVKGGIQKLIRDGDSLTESQLKSEIAVIRKALALVASIKLKVIQAEVLKEK